MKAVVWHGKRDVSVDQVPDPTIEEPTDAIVRITSRASAAPTCISTRCSAPFMEEGDILGHEPMGIVEEVGPEVERLSARATASSSRSTSPAATAGCASRGCRRSARRPRSATRARARRCSATRSSTGQVPGGQAEYLRVPQAQYGPIKVPEGPPDERFVYLSDVLPTAWQAVAYADVPEGGTSPCSAWGRSATWPAGSPCSAAPAGDRSRPRAGASAARRRARRRDARPERARRRAASGPSAGSPMAAVPTPSSTRSAWRRTARRSGSSRRRWPGCCPPRSPRS